MPTRVAVSVSTAHSKTLQGFCLLRRRVNQLPRLLQQHVVARWLQTDIKNLETIPSYTQRPCNNPARAPHKDMYTVPTSTTAFNIPSSKTSRRAQPSVAITASGTQIYQGRSDATIVTIPAPRRGGILLLRGLKMQQFHGCSSERLLPSGDDTGFTARTSTRFCCSAVALRAGNCEQQQASTDRRFPAMRKPACLCAVL